MKIDFSQELKTLKGTPLGLVGDAIVWLRDNKPKVYAEMIEELGKKVLTLRDVCATSLLAETPLVPGQKGPSTDEKTRRIRLAMKIDCSSNPVIDLDAKDISYIQDLMNVYPTITCGQGKLLLDGQTLEDLKKEFNPPDIAEIVEEASIEEKPIEEQDQDKQELKPSEGKPVESEDDSAGE